jgi:ABC-type dipeptide/oligopeptide/nickel transport system permease component
MSNYIIRKLFMLVLVLTFVSIITFAFLHAVPGGPFDGEKRRPPEIMANLMRKYHLDEPVWRQYVRWISGILLRFDFGPMLTQRSRTVNDVFVAHFPVSAQLGLAALLVAVGIGIPLGILAALKQNTLWDYLGMAVAIVGVSVPSIVIGPLLILIFALGLGWFPVAGWGTPAKMVMPSFALGIHYSAIIARLTRASMLQVIREDYIRTARAKGLSERMVVMRHALKNAFIPVATVLGPMFAALVTGTLIVEQIFAIPGLGKYFVTSITNRDYSVVMGTILLYAVLLVLANLAVDLTYAVLDPRIRYT